MSIVSIQRVAVGQVGITPGTIKMTVTDSLDDVTTAGFLGNNTVAGTLSPTDIIETIYNFDGVSGDFGIFKVSVSDGVNTLSSALPSVQTPTNAGYVAKFLDEDGTIGQSDAGGQAQNPGDFVAGTIAGQGGGFVSWPAEEGTGSLYMYATANADDYAISITNAEFGQASDLTIPDPGAASANFVVAPAALVNNNLVKASGTAGKVADVGYRIYSGVTGTYAGGGTSNTFAVVGLTSGAMGSCVIKTSTNAVAIAKAVPGTDTLAVTFTADPGAGTVLSYIYTSAASA